MKSPKTPLVVPALLEDITRISQIPAFWAQQTPDAPAIWEGDAPLSYARLQRWISRAAELLSQQGVVADDRVLIVAENSVTPIVLLFAVASLNAWPLSINARMSAREIDDIAALVASKVRVYVTGNSPEAEAHAQRHEALQVPPGWLPVEVKMRVDQQELGVEAADAAGQVALLIATSGSTGTPKAVMVPHRGLLNFCRLSLRARDLRPSDVTYAVLPMSHIFGIATLLMTTLYGGGSLYLAQKFSPAALLSAIEHRGVSMMFGVPTLYTQLLAHVRASGQAPKAHHLRYAYVGASALEMPLKAEFERLFACRMHHGYGMTEYAGSMFITRVDRPRDDTSVGYLNEGCEVRLVNKEGQDVASGEVGEIWIRGPGLMLGYYRAPDLTEQAMRPDGYFNTGDLGRRTEDGALFMVGRSKDMIIRSGFNVYPAEVEAVLNSHPAIHHSAVLGRPETDGNEEVVAFIELTPGATLDRDELRAFLRNQLAPYKQPHEVIELDVLPLLANGKLAKQVLRERLNPA